MLKGADAAVTAVLKAVAQGDTRAALALLKGFGLLAPPPSGLTDPAMVNRQMELDRRQQRIDLASRSSEIADKERKHFSMLHYLADEEESRQRREEMKQANKSSAEKKAAEK